MNQKTNISSRSASFTNKKFWLIAASTGLLAMVLALSVLLLAFDFANDANDIPSALGTALYGFLGALAVLWFVHGKLLKNLLSEKFRFERLVSLPLVYVGGGYLGSWLYSPAIDISQTVENSIVTAFGVLTYTTVSASLMLRSRRSTSSSKAITLIIIAVICTILGVLTSRQFTANTQSRQSTAKSELDFTIWVPEKAKTYANINTPSHDNAHAASITFRLRNKEPTSSIEVTETRYTPALQDLLKNGGCTDSAVFDYLRYGRTSLAGSCQQQPGTDIWYYEDTYRKHQDFAYVTKNETILFFDIPRLRWSKEAAMQVITETVQTAHQASSSELQDFVKYH